MLTRDIPRPSSIRTATPGRPSPTTAGARPSPAAPLAAAVPLPGSKSLTNRELVLAALADGPSLLRAPLHSRDSDAHGRGAARPRHRHRADAGRRRVRPRPAASPPPRSSSARTTIDCGLAGTVMRFVPPRRRARARPDHVRRRRGARRRPMGTMIRSLRGARRRHQRRRPRRAAVHRARHRSRRAAARSRSTRRRRASSSRACCSPPPASTRASHLRHAGERLPSLPHIEMTDRDPRRARRHRRAPARRRWIVAPGPIRAHRRRHRARPLQRRARSSPRRSSPAAP